MTRAYKLESGSAVRGFAGVFVVLAILAVVAPLIPTAGAIFDHHFAERMPDHGHVYFGRPDLRHRHGYEVPHADITAGVLAPRQEGPGVVILPSESASRAGPLAEMALNFKTVDADSPVAGPTLLPIDPLREDRPSAIFLAPPETPPRAQA